MAESRRLKGSIEGKRRAVEDNVADPATTDVRGLLKLDAGDDALMAGVKTRPASGMPRSKC